MAARSLRRCANLPHRSSGCCRRATWAASWLSWSRPDFVCDGPVARGLGAPHPLCDGSLTGEQRPGYPYGNYGSEGTALSAEQYAGLLRRQLAVLNSLIDPAASDEYGSGALRVLTVGCTNVGSSIPSDCGAGFAFVLSSIADDPRFDGGRVRSVREYLGHLSHHEQPTSPSRSAQPLSLARLPGFRAARQFTTWIPEPSGSHRSAPSSMSTKPAAA